MNNKSKKATKAVVSTVAVEEQDAQNGAVIAQNGTGYTIVGKGKVKRVHSLQDIHKLDIDAISEVGSMNKALYRFLKDQDPSPETYQARGWVYCRGFKMRYGGPSFFEIIDTIHYGADLSNNFSDLPSPRDVWEFVSKPKLNYDDVAKPRVGAPKDKKPKPVNDNLTQAKSVITGKVELSEYKIKELYRVIKTDKSIADDVKGYFVTELEKKYAYLIPKEDVDFTALRKKALRVISSTKDAKALIPKLKALLPNRSFNVFFGKLSRKFTNGDMRKAKFISEVVNLVKDDSVFEEKKKPAPKFVGCEEYHISELLIVDDTEVMYKDPKGVTYTVPKSSVMVKYVLQEYPQLHVAIMKLFQNEITEEQFLENPTIKDRFCGFDFKFLNTHNETVMKALSKFLEEEQVHTPFDLLYRNHLPEIKVGQYVMVRWPELFSYHKAKVVSVDKSIRLRYEDGEVYPLYNYQTIKEVIK